jgi:YD repeat-containing protein
MKTLISLIAALLALLPGAASALRISYTYDAAGRMTAVNYNGSSRTAYGYDKNGGLLSRRRFHRTSPPLTQASSRT